MRSMRSRAVIAAVVSTGLLAGSPASAADLVSLNQSGTDSANGISGAFQVSASGRYVIIVSQANDFGPTDTNNNFDLYLRDRQTGVTRLISANAAGTDGGNGFSAAASFSADERFVVFASLASDISAVPDTNGGLDAFLWNVQTGQTTLISTNAAGTATGNRPLSNGISPHVSGNGNLVVFATRASDLGPTDTNDLPDVYVRDVAAGTTQLVSVNAAGTDSGDRGADSNFAISQDGRIVAFGSGSQDLVSLPTGGISDAFARDLSAGTTTLLSVNAAGTGGGNGGSGGVFISADGRFITFASFATDLTTLSDTNGGPDGFVRDLQQPRAALVTVNAAGTAAANGFTSLITPTADGRSAVFVTKAADLGPADGNTHDDIYLRDLQTGAVQLISVNAAGTAGGNGISLLPIPSADGRVVLFSSLASDLVATDTNATADVFLRDTQTSTTQLISINAAGTDSGNAISSAGLPEHPTISPDGRVAVFSSDASDLVATDTNGVSDAFVVEFPAEPSRPALYVTPAITVLADGLVINDEDVVRYSPEDDDFELYFDGSDVGLLLARIDSVEVLEGGDLLLSFAATTFVQGVGFVQSDDIVRFTPSSTGATTAGAFSLFFDGAGHGISGLFRDLDGIAYDGALQFSPTGTVSVDGVTVQNEDVVELNPTTNDAQLLFDGSAFGLSLANVDGVDVLADGSLVLSFDLLVNVPGLGIVEDEDLVRFVPASPGSATAGTFSLYLEGDQTGIFGLFNDINALAIEP
jgi:Tol biopolymer transport system component